MTRITKIAMTTVLTAVPMLPAHLPYLRAMTDRPMFGHVKMRPTMIDEVVLSGWFGK
jgi:hypothetical protein